MIQFRVLGPTGLRSSDGAELRSVLSQPKRVALLLYLCMRTTDESETRNAVLGLFWPDSSDEHARGSLRTALKHLRAALGAEVITGYGDERIAIDATRLGCDVVEFERALDEGRLEDALELYRGDLLEGFLISGMVDVEQWVELQRTRLRDRAAVAARSLMERAATAHDAEATLRWARLLLRLAPYDEGALRTLLYVMDATGDRGGALRLYTQFAERLAAEVEEVPAPETQNLIKAIHERLEAGEGQAVFLFSVGKLRVRRPPRVAAFVAGTALLGVLGFAAVRGGEERGDNRYSAGLLARAAAHTKSATAASAFAEGRRAYSAGRWGEALDAFVRAIEADSQYAAAHYGLSLSAAWTGRARQALAEAERAVSLVRLGKDPEELWQLFHANAQMRRSDLDDAEHWYRELLTQYPDESIVQTEFAEMLFHYNASRDRHFTESKPLWEQLARSSEDKREALVHLARIAATEGDERELGRTTEKALALDLDPVVAFELRALRAFEPGRSAERERLLAELRSAGKNGIRQAAQGLAIYRQDPANASEVLRLLTAPERSPKEASSAQNQLGILQLAQGRIAAATQYFRAAGLVYPVDDLEARAFMATLPFIPRNRTELLSTRTELVAAGYGIGSPTIQLVHELLRQYLMGLLSIRLGETEEALTHSATLEQAAADSAPPVALALARTIRASVEAARGNPSVAAQMLARSHAKLAFAANDIAAPFASAAFDQYLRAELLGSLGRVDEALHLYSVVGEHLEQDVVFRAPAHLRMAQLYAARGEKKLAATHYERFIDLWQNADAVLQPQVAAARQALAGLR